MTENDTPTTDPTSAVTIEELDRRIAGIEQRLAVLEALSGRDQGQIGVDPEPAEPA